MMNSRRGFIAIPLVLSIIIFATVIIFLMFNRLSNNKNFMVNIAQNVKGRLATAKKPNCTWSKAPFMKIIGTEDAAASMVLTCTHIDGISTNITETSMINYLRVLNASKANTTDLRVKVVKVTATNNGYKIVLELKSKKIGNYYLRLISDQIMTKDNYKNLELDSGAIVVE